MIPGEHVSTRRRAGGTRVISGEMPVAGPARFHFEENGASLVPSRCVAVAKKRYAVRMRMYNDESEWRHPGRVPAA